MVNGSDLSVLKHLESHPCTVEQLFWNQPSWNSLLIYLTANKSAIEEHPKAMAAMVKTITGCKRRSEEERAEDAKILKIFFQQLLVPEKAQQYLCHFIQNNLYHLIPLALQHGASFDAISSTYHFPNEHRLYNSSKEAFRSFCQQSELLFDCWVAPQKIGELSSFYLEEILDELLNHPEFVVKSPNLTTRILGESFKWPLPEAKIREWIQMIPPNSELLRWAIQYGNHFAIKLLLERGMRIDQPYHTGQTPLAHALLLNDRDAVNLLKADPHVSDANGKTPLQMLIDDHLKDLPHVISWWMEQSPEVQLQQFNWWDSWPITQQLLEKGTVVPETILPELFARAVAAGQIPIVELLLKTSPPLAPKVIEMLVTGPRKEWGCTVLERLHAAGIPLPENPLDTVLQQRDYLLAARLMRLGFKPSAPVPGMAPIEKIADRLEGSPSLLDQKNLGLFMGDAFLEEMKDDNGRPLEGNAGSKSCEFMRALLLLFQPENNELHQLLSDYQLLAQEIEALKLLEDECQKIAGLENFQRKMEKKLEQLPIGKTCLLPWGWSAQANAHGHETLLFCERISSTEYIIHAFNTTHSPYQQGDEAYVDTHRAWRVPLTAITQQELCKSLMEPQVLGALRPGKDPYPLYGVDALFHLLIDFEPVETENTWMKEQLSGTCSMRCFMAFLLFKMGKETYKEFRRTSKEKLFQKVVDTYGELIPQSPSLYRLLNLVFPDLFKHVVKNPTDSQKLMRLDRLREQFNQLSLPPSQHAAPPVAAAFIHHGAATQEAMQALFAQDQAKQTPDLACEKPKPLSLPSLSVKNIQSPKDLEELLQAYLEYAHSDPSYLANCLKEVGRRLINDATFFQKTPSKGLIKVLKNSAEFLYNHSQADVSFAIHYAQCLAWRAANISNWGLAGKDFNFRINRFNQAMLSPLQDEDAKLLMDFYKGSFFELERQSTTQNNQSYRVLRPDDGEYAWAEAYSKTITDWKECDAAFEKELQAVKFVDEEQLKKQWRIVWMLTHHLPDDLHEIYQISVLAHLARPSSKRQPIDLREFQLHGPYLRQFSSSGYIPHVIFSMEKETLWGPISNALREAEKRDLKPEEHLPSSRGTLRHYEDDDAVCNHLVTSRRHENQYLLQFQPDLHDLLAVDLDRGSTLSILALIDYFAGHLQEFTQVDRRVFFTAHLFTPLVLGTALRRPSEGKIVAQELKLFIQQARKYYEEELILPENRATNLEALCFILEQEQRLYQWLQEPMEGTRKAIHALLEHIQVKQNYALQHRLHLSLVDSYHGDKTLDGDKVTDLITAVAKAGWLTAQGHANKELFPHFEELALGVMVQRHEEIRRILKQSPHRFCGVFQELLKLYNIEIPKNASWNWEGYPTCYAEVKGTVYQIELDTGEIFKNGLELTLIPDSILYSPLYKHILGENRVIGIDQGTYIEVEERGKFRLYIASDYFGKKLTSIQYEIEGEWYSFVHPSNPIYAMFSALPNHERLQVWKKTNEIFLLDERRKPLYKVHANGTYSFPHPTDNRYVQVQTTNNPQFKDLCTFDPHLLVWQKVQGSGAAFLMQCPSYKDEKGNLLEFELHSDKWTLKGNQKLFISSNQTLAGFPGYKRYLILENTQGEREVLLPNSQRIKLESDLPTTHSPSQNLYLAHLAITHAKGSEDYLRAIDYLKKAHRYDHYSPTEQALLHAIFHSQKQTRDHTPQADVVRLIAAWLLQDNQRRNPTLPQKEEIPDSAILETARHYFARYSKLPAGLHLEDTIDPNALYDWQLLLQAAEKRSSTVQQKSYPNIQLSSCKVFKPAQAVPLSRTKPGAAFASSFLHLYQMAKSSDRVQQEQLKRRLKEMQYDEYPGNAGLRLILQAALEPHQEQASKLLHLVDRAISRQLESKDFLAQINAALQSYNSPTLFQLPKSKPPKPKKIQLLPPQPAVVLPEHPPATQKMRYAPLLDPLKPFHQLYADFLEETTQRETIQPVPFALNTQDPYLKQMVEALNRDYIKGCELNQETPMHTWREGIALEQLQQRTLQLTQGRPARQTRLETLEASILALANQLPQNAQEALAARAKLSGKLKSPLSLAECTALFLQGHVEGFRQKTHLIDPAQIQKLFQDIGDYLLLRHAYRYEGVVLARIQDYCASPKEDKLQLLGDLLGRKRAIDFEKDPTALLIFEAELDILYYEHQVQGLRTMSEGKASIVLQRTQAAGKTFAFGHTMPVLLANGYDLPVHVPPSAHYETTLANMSILSNRVFGQKEHTLHFDDHPQHFTPQYLEHMIATLERCIVDFDYMTLNAETLGSLDCKYIKVRNKIDTLLQQNKEVESDKILHLEKRVQRLKHILHLLRTRAVFTIEEFHQAVRPDTELNMPDGKKHHIKPNEAKLIGEILKLASLSRNRHDDPLLHYAKNEKVIHQEADFGIIRGDVSLQLLYSPLWKEILGPYVKEKDFFALRQYLLGESLPDFVQDLPEEIREWVTLAKCLLSEGWLKEALQKMVYKEHGLTEDLSKPKIAVPFQANMKEAVNSEFSDVYVMELFTYISYLVEGLSNEQVGQLIDDLRKGAYAERTHKREVDPEFSIHETKNASQFTKATGLNLFQIDRHDAETLCEVAKRLKSQNPEAISLTFEYVQKNIFPKVDLYSYQITSNGRNKLSMAKRKVGWTGSFDNPHMVPPDMQKEMELGTNGRTVDLFLRQNDDVWVVHNGLEALMDEVWAKHPEKEQISSVIDVGCHFGGYSTLEVSQMLCRKIKDSHYPGVIFYDKAGKLYFMSKDNPNDPKPLSGSTQLIIEQETGHSAKELFYYFDHDHFTGTDFLLDDDARAILTCDDTNRLFELIQGGRRLRGLQRKQRLSFAVHQQSWPRMAARWDQPQIAALPIGKSKTLHVDQIVLYTYIVDVEKQRDDNFLFCTQDVEDLVKRTVKDKLYRSDVLEERKLFRNTSYLFVKNILPKLFAEFAEKKVAVKMEEYLQAYLDQLMNPLQRVLPLNSGRAFTSKRRISSQAICQTFVRPSIFLLELR